MILILLMIHNKIKIKIYKNIKIIQSKIKQVMMIMGTNRILLRKKIKKKKNKYLLIIMISSNYYVYNNLTSK
jgi:hypothetical protein